MILVLALTTIVIGAVGAILGALLARYLPKVFLFVIWGALLASIIYLFLQGRTLDDYERTSANMLAFAVLLPLLIGSLITGNWVRRKQHPHSV